MNDFALDNHGSIWLLTPLSDDASQWVADHLPDDAQMFGLAFAIEHRYVDAIAEGIRESGLEI